LWTSIIGELYSSKALNLTQRKLKFVQVHPAHRRSIFLALAIQTCRKKERPASVFPQACKTENRKEQIETRNEKWFYFSSEEKKSQEKTKCCH
jgi:hypothetical protein